MRKTDLAMPTLGYIAVGVSAFALLASGPRLLGPAAFSELAIAWTLATIFSSGLAVPAEQTVVRNWQSGGGAPTERKSRIWLLAACAPLGFGLIASIAGVSLLGLSTPIWWLSALVACIGWVPLVVFRGRLAGWNRFHRYGITIMAEGLVRLVLVAGALLMPQGSGATQWALALAVGLPLLVSALVGFLVLDPQPGLQTASGTEPVADGLVPITVAALAMQVLLNVAPLWLGSRAGIPPATAGLFVSASTYMRIPVLATGGTIAVVLSRSSAAWATGNVKELPALLRHYVTVIGGACVALAVLLVMLSPVGLLVMYGPEATTIETPALIGLGFSTAMFVVGNVATQALVGSRRASAAAWCWVAAATATLIALGIVPASIGGATLALVVGSSLGCVLVLSTWRRTVSLLIKAGTA